MRTGWLKAMVIVPRPVQVPGLVAQELAATWMFKAVSPVSIVEGEKNAEFHPRLPRVAVPDNVVKPETVTTADVPEAVVSVLVVAVVPVHPVTRSYAAAFGLAPNVRTLMKRMSADSQVRARKGSAHVVRARHNGADTAVPSHHAGATGAERSSPRAPTCTPRSADNLDQTSGPPVQNVSVFTSCRLSP